MARRHHLPKWALNALRYGRSWERTAERHWPMTAYALLSVAAGVYVIQQLHPLIHLP